MANRSVLITGCSEGGTGAALATAFHKAGFHVYATARNPTKMKSLAAVGIETLTLDIQSKDSIADCVKLVPSLDILVNNAGASYPMPVTDIDIEEGKKLFDLNVWAQIAITQAFMPKLMESPKAMIVNHSSSAAHLTVPFGGAYNASKAAFSMFTDTLRLELQPFDITVVDLNSALIQTNIFYNLKGIDTPDILPADSIYGAARDLMNKILRQEHFNDGTAMPADVWAKAIVQDLSKANPPMTIWRGARAILVRFACAVPRGWMDGAVKKETKLDEVDAAIRQSRKQG